MKRSFISIFTPGCFALIIFILPWTESVALADDSPPPPLEANSSQCATDITPPGGDGWVDVADLLELLTSWGACSTCPADITPPGGDGVVNVADLLELLTSWGQCFCSPDSMEPNANCSSVASLRSVESEGVNQTIQWLTSTIDPGDIDLYKFNALETDDTCSSCGLFSSDEDYLLTVMISVPVTATGSYLFLVSETCTTSTAEATAVAPGTTYEYSIWLNGTCSPFDPDDFTLYILVTGINDTVESCDPYLLEYSFVPGCE